MRDFELLDEMGVDGVVDDRSVTVFVLFFFLWICEPERVRLWAVV